MAFLPVGGWDNSCRKIAEALGLKADGVHRIVLDISCGSVVTAYVQLFPEKDGLEKVAEVVRELGHAQLAIQEVKADECLTVDEKGNVSVGKGKQ
jgi:hypothetical protein